MDFMGRTLINMSTFTWNGGYINTGLGSVISNAPGATFVINGGAAGTMLWSETSLPIGTIANAGWIERYGALSDETSFGDVFLNYGGVTLLGGSLSWWEPCTNVHGGIYVGPSARFATYRHPLRLLSQGQLWGTGEVVGDVINGGEVRPGGNVGGTLTIQGNYTQTTDGQLTILVTHPPGSPSGRLVVRDAAALAGYLYVIFDRGFKPGYGDKYDFMAYDDHGGDVHVAVLPLGYRVAVDYAPAVASLTVIDVPPLLSQPAFSWELYTNLNNTNIYLLSPILTWMSVPGSDYRLFHATNVASPNWRGWPDSGPPAYFPAYITATGTTMTAYGPPVGIRLVSGSPPRTNESVDRVHFFRIEPRP
jgi:hypothetical protein